MRRRPLAELWAWLIGLLVPLGGFATALVLAAGDVAPAPPVAAPATTTQEVAGVRVAGAMSTAAVGAAPTATPRDALSAAALTSTAPSSAAVPSAAVPSAAVSAAPPRGDVAGVQLQAPPQAPVGTGAQPAPEMTGVDAPLVGTPLLGRVGGHAVPPALPAAGLALTLAGFALRGHTSARWTSSSWPLRSVASTRKPSRSSSSSSRRT